MEKLVYTPAETQKLLGLGRGTIYEALRTGAIPSVRVGRKFLIPRAALERMLEGGTAGPQRSDTDV